MDIATAAKLRASLDAQELPDASAWQNSPLIAFCADWRSENPDPGRETGVQLLWSPDRLFIRFRCRFRELFVYDGGNGRRDKLWLRDVAEVFIRPESGEARQYKEFEISPNGDWLDLDIASGQKSVLMCDLRSRVSIDHQSRIWIAELSIPFSCLTAAFDLREAWRVNFFRIEGPEPNRFYSSWRPTHTPQPNFHVPEAFGHLKLEA